VAGQYYRYGSDKIDYAKLATWCRARPGEVVVCENEGAKWLPFKPLANVKTTRADSRSREVLWQRSTATDRTTNEHINGHQLNGKQFNGHKLDGDQLNGHQLNGHKLNGHKLNGAAPKSRIKVKGKTKGPGRSSAVR